MYFGGGGSSPRALQFVRHCFPTEFNNLFFNKCERRRRKFWENSENLMNRSVAGENFLKLLWKIIEFALSVNRIWVSGGGPGGPRGGSAPVAELGETGGPDPPVFNWTPSLPINVYAN